MELVIGLEDFKEIVKLLPQLLRNKLIGTQFAPSIHKVLKEELTMEQLQELFSELFSTKTYQGKSFNSFNEFIPTLTTESGETINVVSFHFEMIVIEDIVASAYWDFKNHSGKLSANINLMMDDCKNEIIEKVIYDRIRPFENLRTIFNMRYDFISGTKDKETLFDNLKSELGPWLQAKVKDPSQMTLKEFSLFYNSKTLKTDKLFAELL